MGKLNLKTGNFDSVRRLTILLYIIFTISYIGWRLLYTLNPEQLFASILFITADIISGMSAIFFAYSLIRENVMPYETSHAGQYSVDVFITTINESPEILAKTITHCLNITYSHKTWVLDDGNRAEIRLLAQKLGAGYIARTSNKHAKAGNLNNALMETSGDIIAVFDADFIPAPDFINRLIGYFDNPEMAIVQTPQKYYNEDSFQHRKLPGGKTVYCDQDTFLDIVLPARSAWNAAYWIGTNALLRRQSIVESGGFQTRSVTEDILTSIYIHAAGWKSIYVNEPMAWGLAPANISQYAIQRLRWAKGAFQILRRDNPLFKKSLSFKQRVFYFSSLLHFTEGSARILYYLFPAFFFIFRLTPVKFSPATIFVMTFYFISGRILISFISPGRINLFYDEVFSVLRAFIYSLAIPALVVRREQKFITTPKFNGFNNRLIRNIFGPLLIFTVNFSVFTAALINPAGIFWGGMFPIICFVWCIWFLTLSATACYFCFSSTAGRRASFMQNIPSYLSNNKLQNEIRDVSFS